MKEVFTLDDLRDWPAATAGMVPPRLAVLGDPVAHSASPPMHNAALAACGIQASYTRIHLRASELAEGMHLLKGLGFIGVNCTIPHKAAALELVDEADEHARRIGVVNTIAFRDGRLLGHSTDGPGLARAVAEQFGTELGACRVLILGAGGGAGRAIAMECAMRKCPRIALANRSVEKLAPLALELAAFFPGEHLSTTGLEPASLGAELAESDLLINCTSVGMKADDPSPLPATVISARHLLYDTIYTQARTPLMRAADQAGARSANGLSMLLHQGALAFEIWFGRPAPLEAMRRALLAHTGQGAPQ